MRSLLAQSTTDLQDGSTGVSPDQRLAVHAPVARQSAGLTGASLRLDGEVNDIFEALDTARAARGRRVLSGLVVGCLRLFRPGVRAQRRLSGLPCRHHGGG